MIVTHYVVAIFALGISLGPYPVVASANEYAALLESEGRYQNRRHDTLRRGRVRGERELRPKKDNKTTEKKSGKKGSNKKCKTKKGGSTCIDGSGSTGGICFMVYEVADNDLDPSSRVDVSEMTKSDLTKSASTTTWVYYDALTRALGPLPDVYNKDGTALTGSFDGSRYLTWDHDLGKMVVDTTLTSEVNSDLPSVLQDFIEHGLKDCVVKGSSEFFLTLASHGSGFAGFGGDDHTRRRSRRLIQSNPDINLAIQGALSAVPGAPKMLDVLGFDACIMQAMDALDDFATTTKYYLASEANEPLHGWAYNELRATTSSLDLAVNVLDTYLQSTQGSTSHENPKTMAVADSTAYVTFRKAWDALCSCMADILSKREDADFHASLIRARDTALSFGSYLDAYTYFNSAIDIGDFFAKLFDLCDPVKSSPLYGLLTNARAAYSAMFIKTGFGPGTDTRASGMHITWMSKEDFTDPEFTASYSSYFFPTTGGPPPLMGAPHYSQLLGVIYNTATPTTNTGPSVCGKSSKSSRDPLTSTEFLIAPAMNVVDDAITEIRSEITRNVDFVFVEYGIDVTHWLQDNIIVRRRLDGSARRRLGAKLPLPSVARHRENLKWRYRDMGERSRRLQDDREFGTGDHFFIFGGNIAVQYNGSNVVAPWGSTFYWIQSGDDKEPLYAFDDGGGLKSIPVCYFNQNISITSEQIALGVTVDEARADLGCELGFLSFADSNGQATLHVYREGSVSTVPKATGQKIVPISYIDYSAGNVIYGELLGGFSSIVVPWTPDATVSIFSLSDVESLGLLGADTTFMDIVAHDVDAKITDFDIFPNYNASSAGSVNRRQLFVAN